MQLRLIIQWLVLFIGVLFESVRGGGIEVHPFVLVNILEIPRSEYFGDSEILRAYVYYFCEHLKFITVALMMWWGSKPKDYDGDRLFVTLAVVDFVDYLFWGNNIWFFLTLVPRADGYGLILPMSMNVLSLTMFGLFIFRKWKTNG